MSEVLSNTLPQTLTTVTDHHDGDFVNLYISNLSSVDSKLRVRQRLNYIAKMLGFASPLDMPWTQLRHRDLTRIKEQLELRELSPSTINGYLSAIKGVVNQIDNSDELKISEREYRRIKDFKGTKGNRISKGRAITKKEMKAFFNAINDNVNPLITLRDSALFIVMFSCGLRRSEAVSITVDDINFKTSELKISGKGNKERIAYLQPAAAKHLATWVTESEHSNDDNYVFLRIRKNGDITDQALDTGTVNYLIDKYRGMAGIAHFSPHDFRRTFATELNRLNTPMSDIQELLGHSDVNTTRRYIKSNTAELKRASRKIKIDF